MQFASPLSVFFARVWARRTRLACVICYTIEFTCPNAIFMRFYFINNKWSSRAPPLGCYATKILFGSRRCCRHRCRSHYFARHFTRPADTASVLANEFKDLLINLIKFSSSDRRRPHSVRHLPFLIKYLSLILRCMSVFVRSRNEQGTCKNVHRLIGGTTETMRRQRNVYKCQTQMQQQLSKKFKQMKTEAAASLTGIELCASWLRE